MRFYEVAESACFQDQESNFLSLKPSLPGKYSLRMTYPMLFCLTGSRNDGVCFSRKRRAAHGRSDSAPAFGAGGGGSLPPQIHQH